MVDKEIAIKVENLTKTFKIPLEAHSGLKQKLINTLKGRKGYREFTPLRDISFEVEKGDFFGIVGRNGSGKSTLLKSLAGIYTPNGGAVQVNGTLVPFIELGVGFNPELTGRENVFLNGALLGFSRKQMEEMYDDIVEFAELQDFMEERLKNFSSGMQVRLAFSIAIRADGDVLLLDEVLAVGDEAFQKKCYSYFAELKRNKKTVVLVTHSMESVRQFCNKALLIDKGHKTEIGTPLEITRIYQELNATDEAAPSVKKKDEKTPVSAYANAKINHKLSDGFHVFDIQLRQKKEMDDIVIAMGIYKETGEQIYRWTSDEKIRGGIDITGQHKSIQIQLEDILPVGDFIVNLYIKKQDRTIDYATFNEIVKFRVQNTSIYKYAKFWRIPEKTLINNREV